MAKRFTDTERFKDVWYRKLTPVQKCIWEYALSQCDHTGFLSFDIESMSFHIGAEITKKELSAFNGRFIFIREDLIFIPKFIKFQYGELDKAIPTHRGVIKALEKHNIDLNKPFETIFEGFGKGFETLQDKEKDMNKDIDLEKGVKGGKTKSILKAPKFDEVEAYAKERNRPELAKKFFDYFTQGNWIDAKGEKVRNWKQKFITWEDMNSNNRQRNCKPDPYSGKEAPL